MDKFRKKRTYELLRFRENEIIKSIRDLGFFDAIIDGEPRKIEGESEFNDLLAELEDSLKTGVCVKYTGISHGEGPLKKAHEGDAAYDIRANISGVIEPGAQLMIPTGVSLAMNENYCCLVLPRSGLANKNGVTVANSPGLIDSGYRGDIGVILKNHGKEDFTFSAGDRIAQILFLELPSIKLEQVEELPDSDRGEGGFGSTGV